uniref:Uncharacterized protein n=1 Tax=Lepeophtheirus salmonis TaxID=72036 RepID=A0A0K2T8C9_LEPSM
MLLFNTAVGSLQARSLQKYIIPAARILKLKRVLLMTIIFKLSLKKSLRKTV